MNFNFLLQEILNQINKRTIFIFSQEIKIIFYFERIVNEEEFNDQLFIDKILFDSNPIIFDINIKYNNDEIKEAILEILNFKIK